MWITRAYINNRMNRTRSAEIASLSNRPHEISLLFHIIRLASRLLIRMGRGCYFAFPHGSSVTFTAATSFQHGSRHSEPGHKPPSASFSSLATNVGSYKFQQIALDHQELLHCSRISVWIHISRAASSFSPMQFSVEFRQVSDTGNFAAILQVFITGDMAIHCSKEYGHYFSRVITGPIDAPFHRLSTFSRHISRW